jgi:hypothetical protein
MGHKLSNLYLGTVMVYLKRKTVNIRILIRLASKKKGTVRKSSVKFY